MAFTGSNWSQEGLQQFFEKNRISDDARVHFGNVYNSSNSLLDGCSASEQLASKLVTPPGCFLC